jgi:cytidine deaminase
VNDITQLMMSKARLALQHAYAPYSKYTVGACLCTEDQTLYTGVNVENSSYGLTICAESSAICQMITAGERQIKSMVILSGNNALCPPCGACRQRIYEFSTEKTQIYLCDHHSILKKIALDDLLPMAFSLSRTPQ